MKLAISSLAWTPEEDDRVARVLEAHAVAGLELVPTKRWPDLASVSEDEITAYRRYWNARGIEIVALQAVLFGREDLTLFGSQAKRDEGIDYFASVFRMARTLGARVIVYGSPRNRQGVDGRDPSVIAVAEHYFRRLGALAREHAVCLCIEPLPAHYPCDFITTTTEALRFVDRVNDSGFGLHLDSASLYGADEDVPCALAAARGRIEHVHLSEPGLAPVAPGGRVPLAAFLRLLMQQGYGNWASIEMREAGSTGTNPDQIAVSLDYVCQAVSAASRLS
jgi:sugar phosphate isomerase/epimerase